MEWFVGGLIVWATFTPVITIALLVEGVLESEEREKQAAKRRKQVKTVSTGGISQNRKAGAA